MRRWWRIGWRVAAALAGALALALAGLAFQARRTPDTAPVYVALGSSYAAGAGLGPLQAGSPLLCARSVGGYPTLLAARIGLPLVDMACGGAVTHHLLRGGQFFQGPQIRVIDPRTQLVTITVGGNDVGYVGDLSMLAARRSTTLFGGLVRRFWHGPDHRRDWQRLHDELLSTLRAIHARAPAARIVVATYPAVLPPTGTCAKLGLSAAEADRMRAIAARLADVTRRAAREGGAILVDMDRAGAAHGACSAQPWTNGWWDVRGAPDHPTAAGAAATAAAIAAALKP